MKGRFMFKFELFKANNGQWAWRLLSANGKSIAWSGETYHNKQDARTGIELVKYNAALANVIEPSFA